MQVYSIPTRESDPYALPDVEVFEATAQDCYDWGTWDEDVEWTPGWYWWSCLPGCLPDSDPMGPFGTEGEAIEDAQDTDC